jgi:hypothetical protein
MAEDATEHLKNNVYGGHFERTKDFISSKAILSFKDSYRDCLRYMIHYLSDHVNAIRATEDDLNSNKESVP